MDFNGTSFRFQCTTCEYYTKAKYNYTRHMKSSHHMKYCKDVENKDSICKNSCRLCKKQFKTRRQLDYHIKHCGLEKTNESMKETIDEDYINEIKKTLKPISMKEFVCGIVFDESDFVMNDMCKENIFENTISILKRKVDSIDQVNRPFHNFNEDSNEMNIHYFAGNEWRVDSELKILRQFYYNNDVKKSGSFMYYIDVFHKRRIDFYKNKCTVKNFVILNLTVSSSSSNQMKLLNKLMSLVSYIEIADENEIIIDQGAIPAIDSHCEETQPDSL